MSNSTLKDYLVAFDYGDELNRFNNLLEFMKNAGFYIYTLKSEGKLGTDDDYAILNSKFEELLSYKTKLIKEDNALSKL